jgi:hypothetical protein
MCAVVGDKDVRWYRRIDKDSICIARTLPISAPEDETYTDPVTKRVYKVETKTSVTTPHGKREGVRLSYDNGGRGGCTSAASRESFVLVPGIGPVVESHFSSGKTCHSEAWELVSFEKPKK